MNKQFVIKSVVIFSLLLAISASAAIDKKIEPIVSKTAPEASVSTSFAIDKKIQAETVIPFFLNDPLATFAFVNLTGEELAVSLSFEDKAALQSPAPAMRFLLDSTGGKQYRDIDISDWEDGDYNVNITIDDDTNSGSLVRAIRKQTIADPESPDQPINVAGRRILFIDDWYIETQKDIQKTLHKPQLLPIDLTEINKDYSRIDNRVKEFFFDSNGVAYVNVVSGNCGSNEPQSIWVMSKNLKNWKVVDKPTLKKSSNFTTVTQRTVANKFTGKPAYRIYDSEKDGKVNLDQVQVKYSDFERQYGDHTIPARTRVAVWEKPTGEYLILSPEPLTIVTASPQGTGSWKDSNDNFGNITKSIDGKSIRFYQTRAIPRNDPYRVHYDNILNNRILTTWSSEDGINWIPRYFGSIERDDPACLQSYGARVFKVEDNNFELAYMLMYDQVMQKINVELGYSRDGVSWHRYERGNYFAETGELGEWNYGFLIFTPDDAMRVEYDEYYYEPIRGRNVPHYMFVNVYTKPDRSDVDADFMKSRYRGRMSGEYGLQTSPIWDVYGSWEEVAKATQNDRETAALMKLRKEGWVSLEASANEGIFETKQLIATGRLSINAVTQNRGYVKIEVLDSSGKEIVNYCGENAARFTGNSTDGYLVWNKGETTQLPQNPYKLRIRVKDANLYSLNFEPVHKIVYVDSKATGANNGASWQDAFTDLQQAIAQAQKGEQIWVAAGVYKPTSRTDEEAKYISFELKDGIAIYGGFLGTETSLEQRNFEQNITILSGDINDDDGRNFSNRSDNSCHIVSADFVYEKAILDGFTISGGNAVYIYPHNTGGGLIIAEYGSPTISNCNFIDNFATGSSAVWLIDSGSVFENCSFVGNKSSHYGAFVANNDFYGTLNGCVFYDNQTDAKKDIPSHRQKCAEINNCIFKDSNSSSNDRAFIKNNNMNPEDFTIRPY